MYKTKHGDDVDDEEDSDSESEERSSSLQAKLDEKLADVKTLYKKKYGQDVDDEDTLQEAETTWVQNDGITWMVTEGRGLSTIAAPKQEVLELEEKEVEVNNSDDHETKYVEKDGITWTVTRGRAPQMSQLEDMLAQVQSLYKSKYGEDADDE